MRAIASDFFAASPVLMLPVIALVLFLLVFVGACVRAYRLPAAEANRRAQLPLTKDDHHV